MATSINLVSTYLLLSAFSFLSATLVPVSSEAALVTTLALGKDSYTVLIFTTVGNCLGVAFNYWLGWKGQQLGLQKHLQKKTVAKAYRLMECWGKWSLLLSWLPLIGDPLIILAGVLKIDFRLFVVASFPFRFFRYLAIVGLWEV